MKLDVDANDMDKGGELGHLEGEGGLERKSQQPEPNEQPTNLGVKEKEKMPNETFKGGEAGGGIKGGNRTGQISGSCGRRNSQQSWPTAWLRRTWGITGWAERMVLRALVEPGGNGEKGQGSLPAEKTKETVDKASTEKHRGRAESRGSQGGESCLFQEKERTGREGAEA